MPDLDAHLATLVGSRLCHDLISPVGAIQNGLELLALSGGGSSGPEMALISESCASATARIRFFRVAFGSAGDIQKMSARDCAATLGGMTGGGRVRAVWDVDGDQARTDVQLAYLAHLCCEHALPQGGTVTITRDGDLWAVTAEGPRIAADPAGWSHLAGEGRDSGITPDRVQFVLLSVLAQARNRRLRPATDEARARIVIG